MAHDTMFGITPTHESLTWMVTRQQLFEPRLYFSGSLWHSKTPTDNIHFQHVDHLQQVEQLVDFWLPCYGILTFSTHVRRKRSEPLMILHHQGFSMPGLASIESSGPALSSSSSSSSAAHSIDHPPCHLIIITHLRHLRHNCLSCPPFSSYSLRVIPVLTR